MPVVGRIARSLPLTLLVMLALFGAALAGGLAFRLTLGGSAALYFVVWWIALFAILPIAVRSQAEAGEMPAGTDPGAPQVPALREKAILTTFVSTIIFMGVVALLPLAGL